ncbi:hypothetical protein ACFS27_03420 [Promicromonospora vindobonensis]|uniref:Uncharacterized protein n=1 Tax=Promicromonospora vindobonensis TaxID=195748 RepID=A0ABW5VNJ2_9MICO
MSETPTNDAHATTGVQEIREVDVSDPLAVMTALGFDPPTVRAVVITTAGALGISSTYPPTEFDPPPVAPEPTTPQE